MRQQYQIRHEPTILCSLLVKNLPTWLHPKEQKGAAFVIDIDDTTKRSLWMEIFAFFTFSA